MKKILATVIIVLSLLTPVAVLAQPVGGGGDLTFKPHNALPVTFSHDKHVKRSKLKCSSCHYQLFQMAQGAYRMEMKKIAKGELCGRCHNGQASFEAWKPQNCSRCHHSFSSGERQ